MTAKGKGSAQAETNSKFEVSKWQEEYQLKYDSLVDAFSAYKVNNEQRIKKFERVKAVDKESIGVPAGVYIVIVLLGIVLILLWLFKKRLRLI